MTTEIGSIYNTAIALNNIGISLFQQGHYDEAVDILHDAVTLLRQVVDGDSIGDMQHLQKLRKAHQNMSSCQTHTMTLSQTKVCVLTHGESAVAIRSALSRISSYDVSTIFLMRIEFTSEAITIEKNRSVDLESVLILYNISSIHIYIASMADNTQESAMERQRALQLLRILSNILDEELSCRIQSGGSSSSTIDVILFSALVHQRLAGVSYLLDMAPQAQVYSQVVQNLLGACASMSLYPTTIVVATAA